MTLRFTILGSGSSGGVPRADGAWGACDPSEPKNRRSRCSLLIQRLDERLEPKTTVVIDTSPDLRTQVLAAGVQRVDAVLLTHDHADQSHGIDDLRAFYQRQGKAIPTFMDVATHDSLTARFDYVFAGKGGYPAICEPLKIALHDDRFAIGDHDSAVPVRTFAVDHGHMNAVGYRIGDVAYTPDVVNIPAESFDALADLDVWIVDALRWTPHPTHAHVEKTLGWIAQFKPRRAILTNLHIDLDYNALKAVLPPGVEPAFDGLSFTSHV